MSRRAPTSPALAVSLDGPVAVVVDGVELLAWAGPEIEATWKVFAPCAFVGAAVGDGRLWVADELGHVAQRRLSDGAELHRAKMLPSAARTVVAAGSTVAVSCDRLVIWLIEGRRTGEVTLADPVDLALDAEGARLAILDRSGALTVVDVTTATALARISVGGTPGGVCWSPDGFWLVAAGERVRAVRADGGEVMPPYALRLEEPRRLVVTANALALAVQTGSHQIEVFDLASRTSVGSVRLGRAITDSASGRAGEVWLGLEHGDVQRLDLLSANHKVGGAQPERAWTPWALDDGVDHGRLRGALAAMQAAGMPLAVWDTPYADHATGSRRRWGCIVGGILGVLALLVAAWIAWVWMS